MRKIRTQLLPGVTLCQKDGIGLLGILVERGGLYAVRQAFVPVRIFAENGHAAARLEWEISRCGTLACPDAAAAWFPEVADLPYMTDMDYVEEERELEDEADAAEPLPDPVL